MAFWLLRLFLKAVRITAGLVLVGWGIISLVIFILPGGFWTIFIGLTLLSRDIPAVKRFELRLRAWLEKKYPSFYSRVIIPAEEFPGRVFKKIKSFFIRGSGGMK